MLASVLSKIRQMSITNFLCQQWRMSFSSYTCQPGIDFWGVAGPGGRGAKSISDQIFVAEGAENFEN